MPTNHHRYRPLSQTHRHYSTSLFARRPAALGDDRRQAPRLDRPGRPSYHTDFLEHFLGTDVSVHCGRPTTTIARFTPPIKSCWHESMLDWARDDLREGQAEAGLLDESHLLVRNQRC